MFEVVDLEPMVLPDEAGLRRRPAIRASAQRETFAERYDWWTLAYGAARVPGGLVLVCPKLLNFKALVRAGRFTCGGAPLKLRWIRPFRFTVASIKRSTASRLRFSWRFFGWNSKFRL